MASRKLLINIMPRKPISELTPEEVEARREYIRVAVAKHRKNKPPEKDKRGYRGAKRIARQRARRRLESETKT